MGSVLPKMNQMILKDLQLLQYSIKLRPITHNHMFFILVEKLDNGKLRNEIHSC